MFAPQLCRLCRQRASLAAQLSLCEWNAFTEPAVTLPHRTPAHLRTRGQCDAPSTAPFYRQSCFSGHPPATHHISHIPWLLPAVPPTAQFFRAQGQPHAGPSELVCPEMPGDERPPASEAAAACPVCASFRRGRVTAEEERDGERHSRGVWLCH